MLASDTTINNQRTSSSGLRKPGELVGYILTSRNYDPGKPAELALQEKAERAGFTLGSTEWDIGAKENPYRVGLWRTLRHLVCRKCEPRRLPFSLMNFQDFVQQALKPCICGNKEGYDGIVVSKLPQVTSDQQKGATLIVELAKKGKHIIAEDGICLSCCHPATQRLIADQATASRH